jgi:hypothetical protein
VKTQVKMLKVKIKSLADEARIIRLEEKRAGKDNDLRTLLHEHRVRDVRKEQQSALLAYAYLRHTPYAAVEAKCDTPPDWERVRKLVEKFGGLPYQPAKCEMKVLMEWKAGQVAVE